MKKNVDKLYYLSLLPFSIIVIVVLVLLIITLVSYSFPAFEQYGLSLYTTNKFVPRESSPGEYGLLAAIYGTIITSIIAVLIAIPLTLSLVIMIEELLPKRLKSPIIFLTDAMAGFPTVVFGFWGLDFLIPLLRDYVMQPLHKTFGFFPLFSCNPLSGASLLAAGIILAIMITPYMAALVREIYVMIPTQLKEAAISVSSSWYQYIKLMVGLIKSGIIAAVLIGFGRAAGETAAVSLVVGNSFTSTSCLFAPGYTVSSFIANQFGNSSYYPLLSNVLVAGSLVLLMIGLAFNWVGVWLMDRVRKYVT